MFHKVAPQQAQDDSGAVVRVIDREHVEWLKGPMSAIVEVDFGRDVGVFCSTLVCFVSSVEIKESSIPDKALIIDQIVAGLEAMGSKVELCE
ncbi:MAG TPA: hypothetical protein VFN13_06825 [Rudaea sp.]|nr:hypothetical protein [Rudaea sp.]